MAHNPKKSPSYQSFVAAVRKAQIWISDVTDHADELRELESYGYEGECLDAALEVLLALENAEAAMMDSDELL